MARPLRIEYPGAFYHVINRGNAGQNIFKSQCDWEKFLFYLEKMVERFGIRIHTYCMMTNHYHLLMETPRANLSQSIQWLNVSYAMYFNTKWTRSGHLFQARFKSILIDADPYLKHLSRYIHLNPIRANMVDRLTDYPWSSYRAFVGKQKAPHWLETDWLLKWFGQNRSESQRQYMDFVENIDIENIKDPSAEIIGGLILGRHKFVQWVQDSFLRSAPENKEISGLSTLKPRPSIDEVVDKVAAYFHCEPARLRCKGKKNNVARDVAIFIARDTTGEQATNLGHYFGGISGSAITRRYTVMAKRIQEDPALEKLVDHLSNSN